MLSDKIRELRKEKGFTQGELAKIASLTTSCISMIETGQREANAHTIHALALALNVSSDYLLGIEDDDYSAPTFYTSSEEQELIKAYRQLSFDQQQVVKVQLGALVEVNK